MIQKTLEEPPSYVIFILATTEANKIPVTILSRCLCFNLLGEGFEVALPRVIDTLIGCAIAWAAVSYIWPDWQFRNLPRMLERATEANCRYLDAENISGTKLDRPELGRLLMDSHHSDILLVEQIDRLTRLSNSDWMTLKKQIEQHELRIVSLDVPTLKAQQEQIVSYQEQINKQKTVLEQYDCSQSAPDDPNR